MTYADEQMLVQVMLITGNKDYELIKIMLNKAKAEISAYLKKEYSAAYDNIAVDVAVIKINRLGTECLSSQGYSGVSESYIDGYPQYIINQLNAFKKRWGMV